ncbi:MAG: hypothetical protein SF052_02330 [Bacteroidia bacterium]|nr:hypothetical protein [Bacteroidia bacterium]
MIDTPFRYLMKKTYLLIFFLLPLILFSQKEEEKPISGGYIMGFHKTNRGMGAEISYLTGPDHQQMVWGLDLHLVKELNEANIEPVYGTELGRKYVYGKLNYFFVLHPSVGIQKNLFQLNSLNMINLRAGVKIGPAIGLLTPYYLEIYRPGQGIPTANDREIEAYDPTLHTYAKIFGRAGFFAARPQLQATLGGSVKGYILVDFARSSRYISGFKLGTHADFFVNPVPIMTGLDKLENHRIFVAFSIGFIFGNRW